MASCHGHSMERTVHLVLSLVDTDDNNAVHYLIHIKTMRKFYTFVPMAQFYTQRSVHYIQEKINSKKQSDQVCALCTLKLSPKKGFVENYLFDCFVDGLLIST